MGVNSYQYHPTRVVWNTRQRRWLPFVTVVQFFEGVGVSSSCRLHKNERKAFSILISWSRGITGCTVEFRKKRCCGIPLIYTMTVRRPCLVVIKTAQNKQNCTEQNLPTLADLARSIGYGGIADI
ncbi:uncharacterized protein LOC123312071 [Coccinella septempunctata]|uniref:uncharacterized protein LOC123312071 n=1 Tax=Coccinella septempunctata TaxID=41139 RepID=UPI001D082FF9|nr:uncharacterized protein LOC123312071 [Coccinella septempunctata]